MRKVIQKSQVKHLVFAEELLLLQQQKNEQMYCIATLHPDLVEARRPGYRGAFFTRAEKRQLIRDFYAKRLEIPLCIDHCGATTCGFVVPESERIGRVCDLFNDERGQLMVKLKLDNTHAAYARINRGIEIHKERWGVSVWIDYYDSGRKALTHVALTTDPLFAAHGTWLHKYGLEEDKIDRCVARDFYKQGRGLCYAAPAYKQRLADAELTPRQRREKAATMQQPPPQPAQQHQEEVYEDDEEYDSMDEEQQQQQPGEQAPQQQAEPVPPPTVAKMPNNGVDQNTRPQKRRRAEGGAAQTTQAPQQQPAGDESLQPYKPGEKIDFNDFLDVKGQYDIYTAHIERSKVPFNRMSPDFKRTFNQLEDKMTEIKKIAMEFIDTVEQKKYLAPAIATDYRCAMADHNTNGTAQERVLGFVAASRNYLESNVQEIRLENTSLKEKIKQLEQQQQVSVPAPVQRQPRPSQQRQPRQQSAPSVQPMGNSGRPVPEVYGKWIDDVGGNTRVFDQSKLTPNQAAFGSCFNDMFNNSFHASSSAAVSK